MNTYTLTLVANSSALGYYTADSAAAVITLAQAQAAANVDDPAQPLQPGVVAAIARQDVTIAGVVQPERPAIRLVQRGSSGEALAWLDDSNADDLVWQYIPNEAAAEVRRDDGERVETVTLLSVAEGTFTI